MSKLDNLPKIYYINLDTATERNEHMLGMFEEYGITNFERYEAKRIPQSPRSDLTSSQYGCFISHLEVIRRIAKGSDEFAIVMEDDTDISSVDQWDFTWNQFLERMPKFNLLQLVRCQIDPQTDVKFKVLDRNDHSAGAYLITRDFAIQITKLYNRDTKTLSAFKKARRTMGPVADDALFRYAHTYSVCIFSMKWLGTQISIDGEIEKCCTDYVQSLFQKTITLDDIIEEIKEVKNGR